MTLRAVLAHCWTGSPDAGWYPQARDALAALGIPLHVPALPVPDRPEPAAWIAALSAAIGEPGDDVLLVGHSLGAVAALHWLARAPADARVGAVLLIAPPLAATGTAEVDRFLAQSPDLAAARERAGRIDALLSIADPWLKPDPLALARRLLAELGAGTRIVPDRGHFAPSSGQSPLPELQDWAAGVLRTAARDHAAGWGGLFGR